MVTSILLNGAGVLKPQTWLMVISSLSNLALSIFLTRRLGVIGVCLGSIISQLFITFPAYSVLIPRLFARLAKARIENDLQGVTSLA
jgi:Na+-driven multidrug efflux pump